MSTSHASVRSLRRADPSLKLSLQPGRLARSWTPRRRSTLAPRFTATTMADYASAKGEFIERVVAQALALTPNP